MEIILNNRLVRILIGLIVGLPLTALSLVTGVHGLILGYGGVIEGNPLFLLIGIITITGFIGISGAWRRILKSSDLMSAKEHHIIRVMLFCGVASSFSLAVWAYIIENTLLISGLLVLLAIGGLTFIYATPKKI